MKMESLDQIKELRELTSCGVIDCKKALEEAKGDFNRAKAILLEKNREMAAKKSSRVTKEGRVDSYVHAGNKIAVLLEVNCETDFVARNEDFCRFCKDVAMHIAWMNPAYIKEADVPQDLLNQQPDQKSFIKESCLLNQPFVRDQGTTIQDILTGLIGKIGENIVISRFKRYKVGEVE